MNTLSFLFGLFLAANFLPASLVAEPSESSQPVVSVVPDFHRMQKWNGMHGDSADPFWADDDNLYHFTCDGRGFGTQRRNLCLNKLSGPSLAQLQGVLVNSMDEYGKADEKGPDNATWKVCGQECIDGVFYAFVARNVYGKDSKDPLLRQTSLNASLIKSTDHGLTWTRTAKENYSSPMWPGTRFGAPCFIHYGRDGGRVTKDGADQYVYAISNNGFWNGGDDMILGRVKRSDLPKLQASDWKYYSGGDGSMEGSWSAEISKAQSILSSPAKFGLNAPVFVAALNRYLLVSWHISPTLKKWFEPGLVTYDFYESEHPWGPWVMVSSFNDQFLSAGHMYGPNLCAKYQEKIGDAVKVDLYTSGCPFSDVPTGLYKMWRIPLLLKTKPPEEAVLVNDDDPAIRYSKGWKAGVKRGYHDFQDDVHYSNTAGDVAEYAFTGRGIELLAEKCGDQGAIEIFIDDKSCGVVNLKVDEFPRLAKVRVFSSGDLQPGKHSIRVVNKGSDWVSIDAFSVRR